MVDADCGRRRAVEAAVAIFRLCAHLDAGDIADPHHRAVRIGTQNDIGEFLRPRQPSRGLDIDLELLVGRRGAAPMRPKRGLDVLALHRGNDVVWRQIEFGQPLRIEPDAQRIIQRTEQHDLTDALDPRQRVNDVDDRIIAQIDGVIGVLR